MDTNYDWIAVIVAKHWDQVDLIDELAAEVTSRLAEAYEEGWNAKRELNREYPT